MTWETAQHVPANELPCRSGDGQCEGRAFRDVDLFPASQCWCKKLFLMPSIYVDQHVAWKYLVDTPFEAEEDPNGVCRIKSPEVEARVTEWFSALGIDANYTAVTEKVFREGHRAPADVYVTFLFCDKSLAAAFKIGFGGAAPRI